MTSQIVNKTKFLQKNHLALENRKNTLTYQNLTSPKGVGISKRVEWKGPNLPKQTLPRTK